MFEEARVKLTGWYLLIIMFISLVFSIIIFNLTSWELERGFKQAAMRQQANELNIPMPKQMPKHMRDLNPILIEDLGLAKHRLVVNLLFINGGILVFSAIAGYFLAGKTLSPIEKAMDEQKRFIADASHELRTPLTALKTSIEVGLRDKKISLSQAKELIKSNLEDVDSLQALSNNLLSMANMQSNGQSFVMRKINIEKVIKKAIKKISPLIKEKEINLQTDVKKQTIIADKGSMEKMLLILIDNALKYTNKKGKIFVTAKQSKKNLIIQIKDTGIGISEKDLPFIFDRFYRADQSRSKIKVSGFGLGLSLAKTIVKKHKGSIKVASVLGKGTTFTIKLPIK
ncbi:sensor histidine kinase [Patescibacteria group bacterium]